MKMNSSGKIVTIFLVIFALLLISLTAISMFFFQKELGSRRAAEKGLEEAQVNITSLASSLEVSKKENFVLEEKNKEADERINDLSDEIELEKGLREEMKLENASLKEQLENEIQAKKQIKDSLESQLKESIDKVDQLGAKIQASEQKSQELETSYRRFEEENVVLKGKIADLEEGISVATAKQKELEIKEVEVAAAEEKQVELDKIVVANVETPEGRILSVDTETEFVIINLGEKDGVKMGDLLSVYRGKDYLGDVEITRLQSEMSAADLLPPFSSKLVRKNDQVVSK
ncbi:MAG: hypothetical protein P9X22_00880 [Candidatus Zapsychrus exili]|nr:hypothetical protein [Candidatus Zapsychrus exili]